MSKGITGHHTNLKKCNYCKFSTEDAVDAYLNEGIPSKKIMIGVAYYSRGYGGTDGPGNPASASTPDKSWEDGIVDYKDLPRPGAVEYWDPECKAPYSYDHTRKIYNSYDNVNSVYEKCKYVWEKDLKGCLIWEASGDHPIDHPRSLTKSLHKYLIEEDPRLSPSPPLPPIQQGLPTPRSPIQPPRPTTPPPVSNLQEWKSEVRYEVDSLVTYETSVFKCLQAHTAYEGWNPKTTENILWRLVITPRPPSLIVEPPKAEVPIIEPILTPPKTELPTPAPLPITNPTPTTPLPTPTPLPNPPEKCTCTCGNKKIKSIKLKGDIDFSQVEIQYEEE